MLDIISSHKTLKLCKINYVDTFELRIFKNFNTVMRKLEEDDMLKS